MKTARLERTVAGMLLAAAIWPGVQHVLARTTGVDPWELFGWGMYAVPHPRVEVGLSARVEGELQELRPVGRLRARLEAHSRRRATLGTWVSDEAFARKLLELHGDWEAVTLHLRHWRLDLDSARLEVRDEDVTVERARDPRA